TVSAQGVGQLADIDLGRDAMQATDGKTNRLGPAILITALLVIGLLGPSSASANILTQAGPVQTNPHVYEIFWGSGWNQEPAAAERGRLGTLYNEISGSSWQGILTQYWSPGGFVSPYVTAASYTDSAHGSAPQAVTAAKIATEISEVAAVTGWPQAT